MNARLTFLFTRYSTWVAFIASCAATYWLSQPPEVQNALLAAYPAFKLQAPTVSFIAFLIARNWPQKPQKA